MSNYNLTEDEKAIDDFLQKGIADGFQWPDIYDRIVEALQYDIPDITDTSVREGIMDRFIELGGKIANNYNNNYNSNFNGMSGGSRRTRKTKSKKTKSRKSKSRRVRSKARKTL